MMVLRQVFGQRLSDHVCDSPENLVASAQSAVSGPEEVLSCSRYSSPAFSVRSACGFWGQVSLSYCAVTLGLCRALSCTSGSV